MTVQYDERDSNPEELCQAPAPWRTGHIVQSQLFDDGMQLQRLGLRVADYGRRLVERCSVRTFSHRLVHAPLNPKLCNPKPYMALAL